LLGIGDLPYALAGAPVDIGNTVLHGLTLGRYNEPEPTLGSAHLKRLGTQYLGREADSTDPAMRNMRTAGEVATALSINPFRATQTVAAKTDAGLKALAEAKNAKLAEAESALANKPKTIGYTQDIPFNQRVADQTRFNELGEISKTRMYNPAELEELATLNERLKQPQTEFPISQEAMDVRNAAFETRAKAKQAADELAVKTKILLVEDNPDDELTTLRGLEMKDQTGHRCRCS